MRGRRNSRPLFFVSAGLAVPVMEVLNMKQYWMNDVKNTERAIYIGHITSEEVCHGIYEDKKNRLEALMKEVDMTGMRFSVLRDLGDEYPCAPGAYYGKDVWLIVKRGCLKKNSEIIDRFKSLIKEEP